jgi:hypothetical protein
MDEMRFQNKVSLSTAEFEVLQKILKQNVAFQINWFSFRLQRE